jgi:uncharacterized protein
MTEYFAPVETHMLRSKHVAQTFRVDVMQPARKRGEIVRFPVIYATDANLTFDVLKGISYGMQLSARVCPRFILVGIGYPAESPLAGTLLRMRDFTFPGFPRFMKAPPALEGLLEAEEGTKSFEGAGDFQRFIGTELIPFIDAKYDTCADRTYFGHSAGGSFGLYSLFTQAELFRNYIIASPALHFRDESATGIPAEPNDFGFRQARQFISSGESLNGVRMYMAVGSEEEYDPDRARWRFTSSFYRMASLLKTAAISGLQLTTEVLATETHMTTWPVAFIHGVRSVFGRGDGT